ncbi:MAG: HNH endonuclease [Bacteroidia bacterium]
MTKTESLYKGNSAVSRMRIDSIYSTQMIDACHIVPFSVNQNDSVNNGIALCPNLHRAFDRGLISVDDNYRVLVSQEFTESETHPYSIRKLRGTKILLPFGEKNYPARENFKWHRDHVFRNS